MVSTEGTNEWFWFWTVLTDYLGRLKPIIMSKCNQGPLDVISRVFGFKNHSYSLRHLWGNFVTTITKHRVCCDASKEFVMEMFKKDIW